MIKRLRVTVDGKTYDVTVEVPDEATIATSPAAISAPTAPVAPAASTTAPSGPAPALPAASASALPGASAPGDVPSPLAGRVTAVAVQVGQDVAEGDHLLTLEAMKMNTFVFAPKSGKVTAVKTEVGGVVEEGQALITIG
jgi:biotin carboxyl carrier protein